MGTLTSLAKVLCSVCWTHINDFHNFQQKVITTRSLLCETVSKVVPELVVLPNENKDFFSEDDFSDNESLGFDSDIDDVPLKELFKTGKQLQEIKESSTSTKRGQHIRNVDDNAGMTGTPCDKDIHYETKEQTEDTTNLSASVQLKEELLTDDDILQTKEIKTENRSIETVPTDKEQSQSDDVLNKPSAVDAPKTSRRGRKSKHSANKDISTLETKRKQAKNIQKKKETKLLIKEKDPNKKSYMDKCRENDEFIAQWKPNLDCDLCPDRTATNFNALREHFREIHKTRCYIKCCDRKFYRRCVLMEHISLHINPETHKCDICGKSSTTKHNLKLHKQVMHGTLNQFECEICHRQFNQKPTLDRHLLTHVKGENKFFCKECDKGYVLEVQLKSHVKTVHGVDCVCDQCGRTFHGANALKKHLMDHMGVPKRKYTCDICGAKLNTNNNLRRHRLAYHHDGTTAYICSICGKVSSSENALRAHKKRVHEENRKHKCTFCEKAFKRPKDLREHVATHTGVDLYQCPHCPQTFKVSANMHHHRKRAHPAEWEEARRNRLQLPKVNIMEVTNQIVM